MSGTPSPVADDTLFQQELEATLLLLERPGRKVLVVGIAIDADGTSMAQAVSDGTSKDDALAFIAALARKLGFLCHRVIGR